MSQPRQLQIFLSRYPEADAARLAAQFTRVSVNEGTQLFARNDASTDVYFIEAGTVKSINHSAAGKMVFFFTYKDGDMFGHFAGLTDGTRSADIVADTDCVLWRCSAVTFHELVSGQKDNALEMMRILAGFLRKDTDRITAISGSDAASRLCLYLKETSEAQKSEVITVPDRDDWASYLNLTRESLSRELNELIRLGIIEKTGRHGLKILDKSQLP